MKRLICITVLLLLAGLPLAAPLLAKAMPCCQSGKSCDPMFRPDMSCCKISAIPGTITPAKLAVSPLLPVPVQAQLTAPTLVAAGPALSPDTIVTSHTVFLQNPLRI